MKERCESREQGREQGASLFGASLSDLFISNGIDSSAIGCAFERFDGRTGTIYREVAHGGDLRKPLEPVSGDLRRVWILGLLPRVFAKQLGSGQSRFRPPAGSCVESAEFVQKDIG